MNLPASARYTYGANGNLLSDGIRCFAYDDENELTSVWVTNAWREDFVYDGLMRRRVTRQYTWNLELGTWNLTNEIRYIYDGRLVVQERDANNIPKVTYTRGIDLSGTFQGAGGIGGLLARTDMGELTVGDPDASAYYFADGLGNITALVDTSGNLVAHYEYDPFGNTIAMSGPLAEANTYRFSSKEWDDEAGLYYYGFRFYDPELQRWVNTDPLGEKGGINLYRFVSNDPLNVLDSFGLQECFDFDPFVDQNQPRKSSWEPEVKDVKGNKMKASTALAKSLEQYGAFEPGDAKENLKNGNSNNTPMSPVQPPCGKCISYAIPTDVLSSNAVNTIYSNNPTLFNPPPAPPAPAPVVCHANSPPVITYPEPTQPPQPYQFWRNLYQSQIGQPR